MKVRRILSVCLAVLLFIGMSPIGVYAAEELSTTWGNLGRSSSEIILDVDYGTEPGKVLFHRGGDEEYETGPEAFYLENENSIYILDTLNKRINHYENGTFSEMIALENSNSPQSFLIAADGTLYVYDTYYGEAILRIYMTNGLEKTYVLEDMDYINIRNIRVGSENMIYLSDWYDIYLYDISGEIAELVKKTTLECVENQDVTYSKYIGGDINGHYEMQTTIVESSMLLGEISVVAYDNEEITLGSARVPLEDFVFRPNQYIQIGTDGKVYFMIPMESGLQIRKVTLGSISDSELDKVEKLAEEYEAEIAAQASMASAFVSLTRQEVLERANLIVGQSWTLSADNVDIEDLSEVELPVYIDDIVKSGALDNGGTVTMSGVPYCWGGYDSRYTSYTEYDTFSEAIEHGYVAGNRCTVSDIQVEGTAGLDCSGFVSAAYGISRLTTAGFDNNGTAVTKDTINTMDYLVRRDYYINGKLQGNHVILFYNWQATDKSRMLIIETSLSTEKTIIRIEDTDEFLQKGYEMKTPW